EKMSYKIIDHLLASGAYGGGQSSWGPAIYGLTRKQESDSVANEMKDFLKKHKIQGEVIVSAGRNRGADIEVLESDQVERPEVFCGCFPDTKSTLYETVPGGSATQGSG
ncbi:MAG: hypothetical protein QMD32_04785, partial [Smithellaceae bacterium]|nr:hypothetical protein [Smithellaceae bacterium]